MTKPLFKRLSPSRSEKVDAFSALVNSLTLTQCYKNSIEIGCKYQPEIHHRIDKVVEQVENKDPPEWWVSLLD